MSSSVALTEFDAVLFDLGGVLAATRPVQAAAWKRTFEEFLGAWDSEHGTRTTRFDERTDYATYVDSKPSQDGVRDFLASRGIELPEGSPDSRPGAESVWGLGNRQQLLVEDELERTGVEAFPGSVAWVRELREAGLRTAVVSTSRNCASILQYAGITNLFDTRVGGVTAQNLRLPAKPLPDAYLEAARRLSVPPDREVVVEDTGTGVQAGRAGAFGLVVGVDRDGHAEELAAPRDLAHRVSGTGPRVRHHRPDHRAGAGRHHDPAVRRR